ncbi:MAG: hypothetical protein LBO78_02325 [Rickettsiales bacterium]|nr:hypothetical protein [Rickettsiales bacterium]
MREIFLTALLLLAFMAGAMAESISLEGREYYISADALASCAMAEADMESDRKKAGNACAKVLESSGAKYYKDKEQCMKVYENLYVQSGGKTYRRACIRGNLDKARK